MANVQAVTDAEFKTKVLDSSRPVVVDFWATWCGPCKAVAPVIDELADRYAGKVDFYKLNIDENADTTTNYKIKGIPTIVLFKEGQVVDQVVGADKNSIESLVGKAV